MVVPHLRIPPASIAVAILWFENAWGARDLVRLNRRLPHVAAGRWLDAVIEPVRSACISTGVAFAFAPGVTVEGMLFDIIRS